MDNPVDIIVFPTPVFDPNIRAEVVASSLLDILQKLLPIVRAYRVSVDEESNIAGTD